MLPVTTKSDSAAVYYFKAWDAFHYKGFSGMFESLDKALEKDSSFFMAYVSKATLYDYTGDTEKYEKTAKQALDCNIKFNKAEKIWKKILETKLADPESDLTSIAQQFVDLYPDVPEAYLNLGFFYSQIKENKKALGNMKKAVELAADFPSAYLNLGYQLMSMERYEEASEALDKYMELLPDAPNSYDSKGDYYMNIGDYELAYECFMKAHELGWSDKKAKKAEEKIAEIDSVK